MLIQRMRDSTEGIMAKIIIGLICIVFALFGFGSITTFLTPVAKVATVNGEDITQQKMELNVERRRRMLMSSDTPIDEDQLREDGNHRETCPSSELESRPNVLKASLHQIVHRNVAAYTVANFPD